MGEEICACIRLKSGEATTEEEIKAFCKGKVGAPVTLAHLSLPVILGGGGGMQLPSQGSAQPPTFPSCPASPFRSPVCRSPTLRSPDTSCLLKAILSPSQERYVRWGRTGEGQGSVGSLGASCRRLRAPICTSLNNEPVSLAAGRPRSHFFILICPGLSWVLALVPFPHRHS